ncbi:MAG: TraB/GumN family protein [Paucibacter sp.]|nr:TraB/GumN family protein [Roseateles sp.]
MRALLLAALLWLAAPARALDCPADTGLPSPEVIAELQSNAKDHGMLWRITRDGRSSYLYGTLHLGRLEWLMPGPDLMKAWTETEVLALEVDTSDSAGLAAGMATLAKGSTLSPAQAKRLAAAAKAACVPDEVVQSVASQPPLMQLSVVTAMAARRDGLDVAYGQEMMLTGMAQAVQRPIVGLESVREQMAAISSASPADTQTMIDEGLDELGDEQSRRAMVKLSESWAAGQLEVLADYESWCHCASTPAARAWLRRLNDERNPPLAERITALHAKGRPVLVGVGALHMTGPKAIPKLLAAKGFKVERIH